MSNVFELSKIDSAEWPTSNPHLMYLRSTAQFLSPSSKRKKRKKKSKIIQRSRELSSFSNVSSPNLSSGEAPRNWDHGRKFSDTSSLDPRRLPRPSQQNAGKENLSTCYTVSEALEIILPRKLKSGKNSIALSSLSTELGKYVKAGKDIHIMGRNSKLLKNSSDPASLFSPASSQRYKGRSIDLSENRVKNNPKASRGNLTLEDLPEYEMSYDQVDYKQEYSEDMAIVCTEEDENTLPPYHRIVPELFYKFAGISDYADSTLLQSREDFEKLLTCVGLERYLNDFLVWYPRPGVVETGKGFIDFNMHCDLFSCKFAQSVLEAQWEYETLCTAILTMKNMDKNHTNRISFPQFLELYRSLRDDDTTEDDVRKVFKKYDSNGIGLMNIVDLFNFCRDEEMGSTEEQGSVRVYVEA